MPRLVICLNAFNHFCGYLKVSLYVLFQGDQTPGDGRTLTSESWRVFEDNRDACLRTNDLDCVFGILTFLYAVIIKCVVVTSIISKQIFQTCYFLGRPFLHSFYVIAIAGLLPLVKPQHPHGCPQAGKTRFGLGEARSGCTELDVARDLMERLELFELLKVRSH
ncbi:hypothetical protein CRG98_027792 [Punica granatum]|uniref:Uncharacterized protein n=1 Tax=Punica granatum TaxID=22663 RepID=A0A2I0J6F9_PUNGR|nr:hypothetical protein CRG98_027792 [Punica granatum]